MCLQHVPGALTTDKEQLCELHPNAVPVSKPWSMPFVTMDADWIGVTAPAHWPQPFAARMAVGDIVGPERPERGHNETSGVHEHRGTDSYPEQDRPRGPDRCRRPGVASFGCCAGACYVSLVSGTVQVGDHTENNIRQRQHSTTVLETRQMRQARQGHERLALRRTESGHEGSTR